MEQLFGPLKIWRGKQTTIRFHGIPRENAVTGDDNIRIFVSWH